MTPQDIELWDVLLSSVLKTAGIQDLTRLEVLKKVANEIKQKLYVPKLITGLLRS